MRRIIITRTEVNREQKIVIKFLENNLEKFIETIDPTELGNLTPAITMMIFGFLNAPVTG